MLSDKQGGRYANLTPDNYTLKEFSIFRQKYTSRNGSFRPNLFIGGGQFNNFYRGAPYAKVEGISTTEAITHGIYTRGAFAGQVNHIYAGACGQTGMLMGFWDLNGTDWHSEGNGAAGIMSIMPGANVSMVRSSYNGTNHWGFPYEWGCNLLESGAGNTWTNVRMQEPWGSNLMISSYSPIGEPGGGQRCKFVFGTFDDTSDVVPLQHNNIDQYSKVLPAVRAMILLNGEGVHGCEIAFVSGSGQVFPQEAGNLNSATHGVYIFNGAHDNQVTLNTPGINNNPSSWYPGSNHFDPNSTKPSRLEPGLIYDRPAHTRIPYPQVNDTPAPNPGPWGRDGGGSLAADRNTVIVNGQVAP